MSESTFYEQLLPISPAEWLNRFHAIDHEKQLQIVAGMHRAMKAAESCIMADHDGAVEQLAVLRGEVARLSPPASWWLCEDERDADGPINVKLIYQVDLDHPDDDGEDICIASETECEAPLFEWLAGVVPAVRPDLLGGES